MEDVVFIHLTIAGLQPELNTLIHLHKYRNAGLIVTERWLHAIFATNAIDVLDEINEPGGLVTTYGMRTYAWIRIIQIAVDFQCSEMVRRFLASRFIPTDAFSVSDFGATPIYFVVPPDNGNPRAEFRFYLTVNDEDIYKGLRGSSGGKFNLPKFNIIEGEKICDMLTKDARFSVHKSTAFKMRASVHKSTAFKMRAEEDSET